MTNSPQTRHGMASLPVLEMLERINDGIVAFDKEMNYTFVNRRACELLGRKPEDLIGRNYWKEYPNAQGTPFANAYVKALETQKPIVFEDYYEPWKRWFENRIYPSKEGLTIFFTEITDRKQAEQELTKAKQLYQDLVETSQDLIWQCDAEGRFTYLNHAWEETLGYAIEEMIGKKFTDFQSPEYAERDMKEFSQLMKGNLVKNFETVHRRKDGREIHLVFNAKFYRDKDGEISGTMGTAHDITERKRHESLVALESQVLSMVARQEPLAQILERIVLNIEALSKDTIASILLLDPDGVHVHYGASPHLPDVYNRAIEGAPIGPVAGSCGTAAYRKEPVIVADIENDPLWEQYRDLILPHGLLACWSTPIINKQGKVLGTFAMYYRERRSPQPEDFKLIEFVTHLSLIVIENEQSREELRESEQKYRNLFEYAHDMIHVVNSDGIIIDANKSGLNMLGYSYDELIGRPLLDVIHPDYREATRAALRRNREQHKEVLYETTLVTREGREIIAEASIEPQVIQGRFISAYATLRDITERKRVEEALRESHARLQKVLEVETVGVMFWDLNSGCMTDANDAFLTLMGYSRRDVETRQLTWQKLTPPEYVEASLAEIAKFRETGRVGPYEKEYFRKDGTRQWMVFAGSSLGENTCVEFCVDISGRKRAEEELRRSQELFAKTFHTSPIATVLTRLSDRAIIDVNRHFEQTFGYQKPEIVGRPVTDLDFWDDPLERENVAKILIREGKIEGHEFRYRTRSGRVGYGLFYSEVFGQYGDSYALTKVVDITERKRAEEEIHRSHEQLRSLTGHLQTAIEEERTRIAREIHDDIGQLLTATKMDLSLLLRTVDSLKQKTLRSELQKEIEALMGLLDRGTESIRKIIRDLHPEVLQTMGLFAGIEWQAKEFEKRTRTRLTLSLPKDEPALEERQAVALFRIVQEALTNIARHAKAARAGIALEVKTEFIKLVVTDNGVGIQGDPFSRPSSYGLLAMRQRVSSFGGTLSIRGEPGKGTSVEVEVPRMEVSRGNHENAD